LFTDKKFQITEETGKDLQYAMWDGPEPANHIPAPSVSLQQQLSNELKDIDSEVIKLFLIQRKASDGSILKVSDEYAEKALKHLPKFIDTLQQFSKEPF